MKYWPRTLILTAALAVFLAAVSLISRTVPRNNITPKADIPRLTRINSADPDVKAEAVMVERMRDGTVLFQRNAEEKLAIASLTKLMTSLVLAELNQPIAFAEFSKDAKSAGASDDKRSDVAIGEMVKAEDLLKMMLIASDNDAAYAGAEFAGGLIAPDAEDRFEDRLAVFVRRMNERAGALGMSDTRFSNPAGMDDPENYSSARDLMRLAGAITHDHPELWAISRTEEAFVFGKSGSRHGLVNTNPLLAEFPAIYGSKTGFDDEARGTLLIVYQLGRDEFIGIAILKSPDRFPDGRQLIRWLEKSFVLESKQLDKRATQN